MDDHGHDATEQVGTNEHFDMKGGYSVIASALDVRVPLPLQISPTMRLDRASDRQILEFKHTASFGGLSGDLIYAHKWIAKESPVSSSGHYAVSLPRDSWRYYVINWSNWNSEFIQFRKAINLVPPGTICYMQYVTKEDFGQGDVVARIFDGSSIPEVCRRVPPKLQVLDEERVGAWLRTRASLKAFDVERYPGIARAIEFFDGFRRQDLPAELQVIGHFMVLEMILTHNPNNKEVGDSLSHQICQKIALLEARMDGRIDYSTFGVSRGTRAMWKTLYALRSIIAHGGVVDFAGRLRILRDLRTSSEFLSEATAALLRHALNEPQLFDDLRAV